MSKRLQVIVPDDEFDAIHQTASSQGLSMSAWVRGVLQQARRDASSHQMERKRSAIRLALTHDFPTADIDEMLEEIDQGRGTG